VAREEVERRAGRTVRRLGVSFLLLVGLAVWVGVTGFYQLTAGEAAVILRLGRYDRTEIGEGPHLHLPWPIETRDVVHVGVSQRREFGNVDATEDAEIAETTMQTGDNNIVLVEYVVRYRVGDPFQQLYRITEWDAVLAEAAQAAMREVVGRESIDGVIAERKGAVASEAAELLPQLLDRYQAGLAVEDVELQQVEPPNAVRQAFTDVLSASQDRNRVVNEAEGYANETIPRARAEAAELRAAGLGYRDAKIADAQGEAARFLALLTEYQKAPAITRKRLYLETMEAVLPEAEKLVVEPGTGTVLPYFPLGGAPSAPRDSR
jgi:membrane protease subunit HflK